MLLLSATILLAGSAVASEPLATDAAHDADPAALAGGLHFAPARLSFQPPLGDSPPPSPSPGATPEVPRGVTIEPVVSFAHRFGQPGTHWLTFGGGAAHNFLDDYDYNFHGAWTTFIARDVEFGVELAAWHHQQDGDDQQSINPQMIFRWHFVNTGDWTVYVDGGIGFMVATGDVPTGGTSINFSPRAGVGFTRALGDSGVRLQVGVRWAHFSNARLTGDDDNPGRDDAMAYVGIVIPF